MRQKKKYRVKKVKDKMMAVEELSVADSSFMGNFDVGLNPSQGLKCNARHPEQKQHKYMNMV